MSVEHNEVNRTRPTWDKASNEEILEEITAIEASLYNFVTFSPKVWQLLQSRGLEDQVREILGVKCLAP